MKHYLLCIIVMLFFCMNTTNAQSKAPQAILNHNALYVVDLKKAADFYINIIGLPQIEEPFKAGKHVWLKTGPHTSLHLILGAAATKEYYKNHHICFSVPSLESFIEKLKKNNIVWEDAGNKKNTITTRPDGVKQLWLQDPDGYWIEVNNDQAAFTK